MNEIKALAQDHAAQARLLIERNDDELWFEALQDENELRDRILDEVVKQAPAVSEPDHVSTAVKALMSAELPHELIRLLDAILSDTASAFSRNRNLQNLLLLTAIKADQARVMGYVERFDDFSVPDVAAIAVGSGLFEEGVALFNKCDKHVEALDLLIEKLHSPERALEHATRVDSPECWSRLAKAQLGDNQVVDAITSYAKARDASDFAKVVEAADGHDKLKGVATFLREVEGRGEADLIDAFVKIQLHPDEFGV